MVEGSKKVFNPTTISILLTIILFLLFFSPYLVKGSNSYILVHDNLNQMNMLGIFDGKMSAEFYPGNVTEHFTLPSTPDIFHVTHLKLDRIFYSIDFFAGFIFNEFFYRLLALAGVVALLLQIWQDASKHIVMITLFGCAFVFLPFWPPGSFSISGIPLLIFAVRNSAKQKQILLSYAIIFIYAFYSNFFFSGVFILFFWAAYILSHIIRNKVNRHLIFGFMLFILLSVISHFPVFMTELIYKIPTNRSAQEIAGYDLLSSLKIMMHSFLKTRKLSHSLHTFVILPSTLIITFLLWKKKDYKILKLSIWFWAVLMIIPFIYGIFLWQPVLDLYNLLKVGFRIDRIYIYTPLVWFSLWSILLYWLIKNYRYGKQIAALLIILQLGINFHFYTYRAFSKQPTFEQFVSEDQFNRIMNAVGKENIKRVGCIGFFPAVANYNGLKTIGSFSSYYPLEFKRKFRKIIEAELDKNQEIKNYFDNKGSACFLFDDMIGKNYRDQKKIKEIESVKCELDLNELKEFGVNILISTVKFNNINELKLVEIDYNKDHNDYYSMFLYQITGG